MTTYHTEGRTVDLLTGEPVTTEYVKRTSTERVVDRHQVDHRDWEIFCQREEIKDQHAGPQSGDWVIFADGVERRISHVWEWGHGPESIQTSDGGSWYLGEGYASFSGALYPGLDPAAFTDTGDWRQGTCWIFHHNLSGAGRGIDSTVRFRVWRCSLTANR